MALWLKQSTSVDVALGPFVDSADGVTPLTGLTITQGDVRLKKNGGAWAQKAAAQTLAHEENGWYEVTLDATDTNTLGLLRVAVHEAGALPVWQDFMVLPANVYDSLVSGSDALDVSLVQWLGAAPNALQSGRVDSYLGAAAAGVLAAANFATGALDAVWSTATRLLTAGTNIVLAKGTGVTGFNDLDAAGVRSAVGLASDNLDTQLAAIDTEVGAVKIVTDKLDTALELSGSDYRWTVSALSQGPGGGPLQSGTLTGSPTTSTVADGALAGIFDDDVFNGAVIAVNLSGQGVVELRGVADYDGATATYTLDRPLSHTPASGDIYDVLRQTGPRLDSLLRVGVAEDSLLDLADGVESGVTLRQALRGIIAVLLGKASGMAGTTATFRDTNDTKDRIVATVDSSGNRTAVTKDLS